MHKIITNLILFLILVGLLGCQSTKATTYYPNFLNGETFSTPVQMQNLQNCSLVIQNQDFIFTFDNGFKRKQFTGTFNEEVYKKNGLINYKGIYNESHEDVLLISTSSTFDNVMFCVYDESLLCIGFSKDNLASEMHIKPSGISNVDINDGGIFYISDQTFE